MILNTERGKRAEGCDRGHFQRTGPEFVLHALKKRQKSQSGHLTSEPGFD
jgi:hypothetical protein